MELIRETSTGWLFIISNLIQDGGNIYQLYYSQKVKRSNENISLDTHILYLFSTLARLYWTASKYSKIKNNPLQYVELIISFSVHLYYIIYLLTFSGESVQSQLFQIKKNRYFEKWYVLAAISGVLAFFIHPGTARRRNKYFKDGLEMCISFNIFNDCMSLIPQIPMLKRTGDVGVLAKEYVGSLFVSRIIRMIFWLINMVNGKWKTSWFLLVADFATAFVVGGFIFSFWENLHNMLLPVEVERTNKIF